MTDFYKRFSLDFIGSSSRKEEQRTEDLKTLSELFDQVANAADKVSDADTKAALRKIAVEGRQKLTDLKNSL